MVPHAVRDLGAAAAREAGPGEDRRHLASPPPTAYFEGCQKSMPFPTGYCPRSPRRAQDNHRSNIRRYSSSEYNVGPASGRGAASFYKQFPHSLSIFLPKISPMTPQVEKAFLHFSMSSIIQADSTVPANNPRNLLTS